MCLEILIWTNSKCSRENSTRNRLSRYTCQTSSRNREDPCDRVVSFVVQCNFSRIPDLPSASNQSPKGCFVPLCLDFSQARLMFSLSPLLHRTSIRSYHIIIMATRGAPRGRGYARGRGGSSFRGRGGTYKHGVWRAPDDLSPITHPAYADEDDSGADLVIQTSDNVLFRVHSYHLKAAR